MSGTASKRLLIVDPNKAYAGIVKEAIARHTPGVGVDVATNVWELKRRLRERSYTAVLADVSTAPDAEEMQEAFNSTDIPVFFWDNTKRSRDAKASRKPSSISEVGVAINAFMPLFGI
jgi:DNA-binding NtrC family response regulator